MSDGEGGWFRRFMRPPVQVTEKVDIPSNFTLPALKAWVGVFVSLVMFGFGLIWFLWITPPDIAKDIAAFVFLFGAAVSFLYGVVKRGYLEQDKLIGIYGFLSATAFAGLIAWVGGLPDTWWGVPPIWSDNGFLAAIQYVLNCSAIAAGGFGAYWFGKEIITPYELTGQERVAFNIYKKEMEMKEREIEAQAEANVWHIEARIEDERGKKSDLYLTFGVRQDSFAQWVRTVIEMKNPDLTYEKWAGRGQLFTRREYDELTKELLAREVLEKDGPAQNSPMRLKGRGRVALCAWLNEYDAST